METIYLPLDIKNAFCEKFARNVEKTKFAGATLAPTGKISAELDGWGNTFYVEEFILNTEKLTHLEIPGHTFQGMVTFENDEKFVHSFCEMSWVLDDIAATRCDICGVKHHRKHVFVLRETETGKTVVVGGSCAKKFKTINLYDLIFGLMKYLLSEIGKVWEDEEILQITKSRELAWELAIAERLIAELGFKATSHLDSTAQTLRAIVFEKTLPKGWKLEEIQSRKAHLIETSFSEYKEIFTKRLEKKWTEFDHNCLACLNGNVTKWEGLTAAIANVKNFSQKPVETTYPVNAPVGKMTDFGNFTIVSKSVKDSDFGSYLSIVAVNEKNEKVWFRGSFDTFGVGVYDELVGKTLPLRGKVKSHGTDISFLSHVKVTR